MSLNELDRRKLICKFCEENPNKTKSEVFKHFNDMGFKKTFIYNTMNLFEHNKSVERKPGSGKKCSLQDSKVRAKLKAETAGRSAKSYRQLGKKYKCDKNTVKRYLESMGIEKKKKKTAPFTTEKQQNVIKCRLRELSKNYFSCSSEYKCVMDDESYFTVEGNEWQSKHYFESSSHKAPDKSKFIHKTKFPGKVLLWLAISERGISDPVFFKGGLAVNAQVYNEKCVPALKNFIKKYHSHDKVIFWPDLASSHYANATIQNLSNQKIEFVPKQMNPPNVPQLRPIETFWANLKRKVYENGYRAKNVDCLILKIKKELKTINTEGIQRSMNELPAKIRKANRYGANFFL